MKIGFCGKYHRAAEVAAAGFDYLEPPVNALSAMTEEEFQDTVRQVRQAGLPTPAFNLLFPGTLALLAPDTPDEAIAAELRKSLPRVRALGGKIVVFGSGKSRRRPEGLSYDEAFRRLTEVTRLTGEIAGENGITVVIEPLNRGETDMINSLAEGACLRAAVNHPAVKLLGDYYHIAVEHQPPEDLARLGGIAHCHIATEVGRRIPLEADEGYSVLFRAMKQTGYEGCISVEGKSDDLASEGPRSVALLKRLWDEA